MAVLNRRDRNCQSKFTGYTLSSESWQNCIAAVATWPNAWKCCDSRVLAFRYLVPTLIAMMLIFLTGVAWAQVLGWVLTAYLVLRALRTGVVRNKARLRVDP